MKKAFPSCDVIMCSTSQCQYSNSIGYVVWRLSILHILCVKLTGTKPQKMTRREPSTIFFIITSWHGTAFHISGPLWQYSTGNRWVPLKGPMTWKAFPGHDATGITQWPMDSLHKGPVIRKSFPFHDVIVCSMSSGFTDLHPTWL